MSGSGEPVVAPADIRELVGAGVLRRASSSAVRVLERNWDSGTFRLTGLIREGEETAFRGRVELAPGLEGYCRLVASSCNCPARYDCVHVAALLLASNEAAAAAVAPASVGPERPDQARTALDQTRPGHEQALPVPGRPRPGGALPAWKAALDPVAGLVRGGRSGGGNGSIGSEGSPGRATTTPLALLFELREPAHRQRGPWRSTATTTVAAEKGRTSDLKLAVRPAIRSATGRWVTGETAWGSLVHQVHRLELEERQVAWFGQFAALGRSVQGIYFGQDPDRLLLDDFGSALLWELFAEAQRLGIALVSGRKEGVVRLGRRARVRLDVAGAGEGALALDVVAEIDDRRVPTAAVGMLGTHGLYAVEWNPELVLSLAPSASPLGPELAGLLARESLIVPAADAGEFLASYYPALDRRLGVSSADGSITLPEVLPPVLVGTARYESALALRLGWSWEYRCGTDRVRYDLSAGGIDPVESAAGAGRDAEGVSLAARQAEFSRDAETEATILERALRALPAEEDSGGAEFFTARIWQDEDAVRISERVLPVLEGVEGVRVETIGIRPEYRELTEPPSLTVTTVETDQRDWFDLGILVRVGEYRVPFGPLFTALSTGKRSLVLIDGKHLSLGQPLFDRLRELIAEAGELTEWETGPRINRYQAALWAEFEDLAEVSEPARSWRESVGGLLQLIDGSGPEGVAGEVPLPAGLRAELRPYQLAGFRWLAFLHRHDLGGILADDMGLGKTVQTLALIAHAIERDAVRTDAVVDGPDAVMIEPDAVVDGPDAVVAQTDAVMTGPDAASTRAGSGAGPRVPKRPFLVVAPTSVVANWAAEASRFTPDLRVEQVVATRSSSGGARDRERQASWDAADIVVTSYALFRLEFETYRSRSWAGLILDEAQFVKNHASRAHRCARELSAPFKLAITGTPMENNLLELWALFDIVAPGLFPSRRRFLEDYVRPVEHARTRGDSARVIARLRLRARPLLLRRTKEVVAPELPPKQEQVIRVELTPAHRRLYDAFLQKERQKLLGLIEDLDRNRFTVFRSLTLLRLLSNDASLIDAKYSGVAAAKIDVLLEQLEDVLAEGHRALIFSQFTSFLGRVAARLEERGVGYAYLDGRTTRRAEVVESFRSGDVPLFLISLKAGGFGLNLTEADYVFLLDPWWNPAAEAQAVDRAHRIGQDKRVVVYRMVSADTIEEKVLALGERKARLFDAVLDDDGTFTDALTGEDIRSLLTG